MTGRPKWSVEQHVRADAERVFVPASAVVGAEIGDQVELRSPESDTIHHGRVIERVSDDGRGDFVIVALDVGP